MFLSLWVQFLMNQVYLWFYDMNKFYAWVRPCQGIKFIY